LPLCSIYVTIDAKIFPTNEQAQVYLRACQMLSNFYQDIHLFRFDDKTGNVYILAGDDLQIIVPPNEPWRFLDETEF
jgi:hypothetical protein